jgi:hypothetical protein
MGAAQVIKVLDLLASALFWLLGPFQGDRSSAWYPAALPAA